MIKESPISRGEEVVSRETTESSPYPSDKIFKAYVEGNSRGPLNFDVTKILVLSAAFEDPNFDWESFFDSYLSDEQIAHTRKLMERMHAKKGVYHEVDDNRLQDLWNRAKNTIRTALGDSIAVLDVKARVLSIDATEVAQYLSNKNNNKVKEQIQEAVTGISYAIRSKAAGEALDKWRHELDRTKEGGSNKNSRNWIADGHAKKLVQIIRAYMPENYSHVPADLVHRLTY